MKKRLLSALSLFLLCAVLCGGMLSLAGCFGNDEGTEEDSGAPAGDVYYLYVNGQTDKTSFIRLNGGKCTVNDGTYSIEGTYTVANGRITIKYTVASGDFDRVLIEQYGVKAGETLELFGGSIGDGRIVLDRSMGEVQDTGLVFYQEGREPGANAGAGGVDDAGNSHAGTYYFYSDGSFERNTYIRLNEDGSFELMSLGHMFTGTYTLSGGSLAVFYTVGGSELDKELMAQYHVSEGQTVELYNGYVEAGMILLNRMMGEAQSTDAVFYLDGKLPGASDGAVSAYNGTYYAEEDPTTYIRLSDGEWLVVSAGEHMVGTYTVSGGRLSMMHTVDDSAEMDRSLMEEFHLKDGDEVELFAGSILQGQILLNTLMGEAQSPSIVFTLRD